MQQARNLALSFAERFEDVKFPVRDRGSNFTVSFDAVFQAAGTRVLRTAVQAPPMNAICERLVGSLRRELGRVHAVPRDAGSAHMWLTQRAASASSRKARAAANERRSVSA
jgi:hypothetical protein